MLVFLTAALKFDAVQLVINGFTLDVVIDVLEETVYFLDAFTFDLR